ncbi:hypothetical protein [Suttonella ornithocola]|uniref:Uncharacterized protein n=1 Tax=Suttonella ornithocola TaxID=279832 RepID=A0A380MXI4_9GAMM|nr:hypothetical protein [Suttonella ornithocola]SUO96147.1 Uncharacterised protein [Suttonella ornithocola]
MNAIFQRGLQQIYLDLTHHFISANVKFESEFDLTLAVNFNIKLRKKTESSEQFPYFLLLRIFDSLDEHLNPAHILKLQIFYSESHDESLVSKTFEFEDVESLRLATDEYIANKGDQQ